jgi:hypothetical protein
MEPIRLIYQSYIHQLWLGLFLVIVLLGIWLVVVYRQIRQLRRDYRVLLTNRKGENLGKLLNMYVEEMRVTASRADQWSQTLAQMERRLGDSVQQVGLVRFNAFESIGGEQSFALALLTAQGDGVVVSSLQGREEGRLYAKPVNRYDSTYQLSVEEKEAITQACQS